MFVSALLDKMQKKNLSLELVKASTKVKIQDVKKSIFMDSTI